VAGSAIGVGNFFNVPSLVLYSGGMMSFLVHVFGIIVFGASLLVGEILWSRWMLRPYWQSFQLFKSVKVGIFPVFSFLAILLIAPSYFGDLGHILMLFSQTSLTRVVGVEPWIVQGITEQFIKLLCTVLLAYVCYRLTRLYPANLSRVFFVLVFVSLVSFMIVCLGIGMHWGFENLKLVFYWDESRIHVHSVFKNLMFSLFTMSAGFGVIYHFFHYASFKPLSFENDDNQSFWKKPGGVFVLVGWVVGLDLLMSFMSLVMISPFASSELQKISLYRGTNGQVGHFIDSQILILDWVPLVLSRASGGEYLEGCLYLGLICAGLASAVSLLDLCVFSFETELNWSRKKSAQHIFAVVLLSLSVTWLQPLTLALKQIGAELFLPLSALILSLVVGWKMPKRYQWQIVGRGLLLDRVFDLWRFSVRYLTPAFILYYLVTLLK
jgi:NSS family neurotransmitter:Na+ symporter